ncbi:MAG TPA: dihydropteroate synthase [Saprospiraceae bacterium]|nr:dihydropteroate synthase [Saprospiraceae bacterium]HQW25064.1 dihydropteroate synthase [Saprospiraceae bacterium]
MGIINATPDSFYEPGRTNNSVERALEMTSRMIDEGAAFLDIGGMSTRPGATEIPLNEELERVIPVIEAIHAGFPGAVISVDTYRATVAEEAIRVGATMVNDISGGQWDDDLLGVVAKHQVAYVAMHIKGTPENMQQHTDYHDVVSDVLKYFVSKISILERAGIEDVLLDPGFGFAKTMEQNYRLIDRLGTFRLLGKPLLIGLSRKSTISKTIGRSAEETLEATTALHMIALQNGASILRVHDVRPAMDAIAVYNQLVAASVN